MYLIQQELDAALVASLTNKQFSEMLSNQALRRYAPYRQALARLTRKASPAKTKAARANWNAPNGSSTPRRRSPGKLAESSQWAQIVRALNRR